MSEQRRFLSNSKVMAGVTTLSRVFGLVRDQFIAFLFGTTSLADVWTLAFQMPNLFRRLIAEGAMSTAFVPLLAEIEEKERPEAALEFTRAIFSLILIVATLIAGIMILCLPMLLPALLRVLAPTGANNTPLFYQKVILPTQILFPYLVFISLAAVCQGVLNVRNRFGLPAATPIILNCCIISGALAAYFLDRQPLWGLCAGVLLGGFLQFFLQWWALKRTGFVLWPVLGFWSKKTRRAVRLWLPTTFSAGIIQINAFVSGIVAVNLLEGAAISLQNSNRMIELILGIVTASLSTALLPTLARQRSKNDLAGQQQVMWSGMSLMSMVAIPAGVGLMVSGPSVINILFRRGAFDMNSLTLTCAALLFHAMALLPISWYRLFSQAFYAHQQVKITVVIAAIAALVNIAGCLIFPLFFTAGLRHCGVALATLTSAWLLFGMAFLLANKRFKLHWPSWFTRDLVKIMAGTLAFLPLWLPFKISVLGFGMLMVKIGASIIIYVLIIWLTGVTSLRSLMRKN